MSHSSAKSTTSFWPAADLQAGLLAIALNHHRPKASVLIVERDDRLCGNHTWSFHESDISGTGSNWLASLPLKKWQGYEVKFADFSRRLNLAYCSLLSSDLESTLVRDFRAAETWKSKRTRQSQSLNSNSIRTSDGTVYSGDTVIDCRGLAGPACGFALRLPEVSWF